MAVCECERPWRNGDQCVKCGKPLSRPDSHRPRGDEAERKRTFEKAKRGPSGHGVGSGP